MAGVATDHERIKRYVANRDLRTAIDSRKDWQKSRR